MIFSSEICFAGIGDFFFALAAEPSWLASKATMRPPARYPATGFFAKDEGSERFDSKLGFLRCYCITRVRSYIPEPDSLSIQPIPTVASAAVAIKIAIQP
jgi:hypothetical protein